MFFHFPGCNSLVSQSCATTAVELSRDRREIEIARNELLPEVWDKNDLEMGLLHKVLDKNDLEMG